MVDGTGSDGIDSATRAQRHAAPARDLVPLWVLWFGLLGGPLAWSGQALANTPVASHGCFPNLFVLHASSVGGMRGIMFGVSVAAVVLSGAALVASWSSWRRTRSEHHDRSGSAQQHGFGVSALETGEGRTRFMALSGVLSSATFLLVILAHTATVMLVRPCFG